MAETDVGWNHEEAWSPQRGLVAIAPLCSGLTYSNRSNSLLGGQDETNIEKA